MVYWYTSMDHSILYLIQVHNHGQYCLVKSSTNQFNKKEDPHENHLGLQCAAEVKRTDDPC